MAICKAHAYYDIWQEPDKEANDFEPLYYGSHVWERTQVDRIYEEVPPVKKEWHPTTWYGHLGRILRDILFWIVGESGTDRWDCIKWTGKVRRVYYCKYCRVRDEVVTDESAGE